jgi:hypothetical protein
MDGLTNRRLVRGSVTAPVPASGPALSGLRAIDGTSVPATSETTALFGGFWMTLNVTLLKLRS